MTQSDDWVTPRLDGVKYFEKPPLIYWVEAAMIRLGGTSERMLRVPIVLFAMAGCLLVYFGVRATIGRDAARIASLVLTTSLLYWVMAGLLILDMAVSVLMTATLICFIAGVTETNPGKRRAWFYGLYASAALATLTKGLIGFLVPGAVMFFWLLLYRQWHRLRPLYLPTGALLFLAIAAPWHVIVAMRNPEWVRFYFVHEHFERFLTTEHGHGEPWWYYLPILIAGMIPWTGLLVPAVRRALSRQASNGHDPAIAGFFVVWVGFILLFFSASESKLAPYILPACAPLAVLTGSWLASPESTIGRAWLWTWSSVVTILVVLAAALARIAIEPTMIRRLDLTDIRVWFAIAAVALAAGSAVLAAGIRHRRRRTIWLAAGLAVFFFNFVGATIVPRLDYVGTKKFAVLFNQAGSPDDAVFHFGGIYQDFIYYTGRNVGVVDAQTELELALDAEARASGSFIDGTELLRRWAGPKRTWVILRRNHIPALEATGLTDYHVCMETARMILLCNQPLAAHEATATN